MPETIESIVERLTKDMITALVQHPEDVQIVRTIDKTGVFLSIRVHADDMGRLIGTDGINVEAIRRILRCAGKARDTVVTLKVHEPDIKS